MTSRGTSVAGSDPRARVLLVDDDPVTVLALQRALTDHAGLDVVTVPGASEGLDLLATDHFDLVVTDVHMPGMTGPELFDHLQSTRPDLPVVVYTAGWSADPTVDPAVGPSGGRDQEPVVVGRLDPATLAETIRRLVTAAPAPVLDRATVDGLLGPSAAPATGVLTALVDEWETDTARLLGELPRAPARTLRAIRGSSSAIGAARLAQVCAGLEGDLGAGRLDLPAALVVLRAETLTAQAALLLHVAGA